MNIGLRALLLIAALVCFIIAIFSDTSWPDWIGAGLACYTAAVLVGEMGWDRQFSAASGGSRRDN